jgi:TIR domain
MAERNFFISYTRADMAWAEWIAVTLENAGYTTFLQAWDFRPGENYIVRMRDTLETADRILAVLSPAYLGSAYARDEWTAALITDKSGRHRLLPVRVALTELPPLLANRVYIDLVGLDEQAAREAILAGVAEGPARHRTPPRFPGAEASTASPPSYEQAFHESESFRSRRRSTRKGQVFVSYSHKDCKWVQRLLVHLKPLEREGVLNVWEDTQIKPGTLWRDEIKSAVESAKVAVLLISADFLASEFVMSDELPSLLAMAENKGTIIMPLIIGPSRFSQTKILSDFQSVNPPDKPLTRLSTYQRDELLVRLAGTIEHSLG